VTCAAESFHWHRTGEAHGCRRRRQLNIQDLPVGVPRGTATSPLGEHQRAARARPNLMMLDAFRAGP